MGILSDFIPVIERQKLGVYSIYVHQHGKVIDFHHFRSDERVNLYSASKVFAAIGIGIAETEGILKLSDKALEYFPEYVNIASESSDAIEICHLLKMCTGHDQEHYRHNTRDDRAAVFFTERVNHPPGTHFFYEDSATYMLGRIIEKCTGLTMLEYLKPRLFEKLDIINPQWFTCYHGYTSCSGGLFLKAEEFSRVGLMLLADGMYQDEQIVSQDFVKRMYTDLIETPEKNDPETREGYGYQLWKCTPPNTYRADGMFGQLCIILKDFNAVVTITAYNEEEHKDILRAVWKDILPKLQILIS